MELPHAADAHLPGDLQRLRNDPPFVLIGTSNSGLPFAYAVTSGLATISGNVVTITGVGTVTI